MNAELAVLRAAYFIAAIALVGEFAFRWCVERPALREWSGRSGDMWRALHATWMIQALAVIMALVATLLWCIAQVEVMSGVPVAGFTREMLRIALFETGFGRISLVRLALIVAIAAALTLARHNQRREIMMNAAGLLALGLAASIAWTGHANVERGVDRLVHLFADVVHVLAAGAWLGALPALASIFYMARRNGSAHALHFAALITRRFSILGIAAVSLIALTGIVNAAYTVATVPALIGTDYGQLLALKLFFFVVMLAFAATNRFHYTPRLVQSTHSARGTSSRYTLGRLSATTAAEIVLGIALLGIVGTLGVTPPGTHTETVWPLRYTVSWEALQENSVSIVLAVAVAAAAILLAVCARRRAYALASGLIVALAAMAVAVFLLAVPAHPTTYFRSPIPYSTASLASGADLYARHCAGCHGVGGHGDGPAAAVLAERPANLPKHVLHHRPGDVFWWIMHGIPGTPMPAFEQVIETRHVWELVHWLRTQAELEAAKRMGDAVQSWAMEAPNFTFQIENRPQESLSDQRGRYCVLFVLFDPAGSLARLRALSRIQAKFQEAGLRVIAMPIRGKLAAVSGAPGIDASIIASAGASTLFAYSILAQRSSERANLAPRHAEFFIDRQGYIRARWTADEDSPWTQEAYLMSQLLTLDRVNARPVVELDHGHAH